ncbi:MAG: GNAT family N-acetyltransferase [Burkholderiaceae bacterium]|jgi:GNAT superfamily N-acetyltransferase|nr:GNAT family N-acetyltransferase [Burkholderiaceae bacterium]
MDAPLPGLAVRRAVRGDLPRLLELLADDDLGRNREGVGSTDPVYAQAFDAIDRDDNQLLLVAERDSRVIGMLQLTFIPGLSRRGAWRAHIEAVRVDSSLRSRGIGGWLIAQALGAARARGCRMAQLTSDKRRTQAHAFYGRLGFVASHEGFKLALEAA